jgi:hypothetical protein
MTQYVPLPDGWRMGGHGDPIAVFDYNKGRALVLEDDGSVRWVWSHEIPPPPPRTITADDVVVKPWR